MTCETYIKQLSAQEFLVFEVLAVLCHVELQLGSRTTRRRKPQQLSLAVDDAVDIPWFRWSDAGFAGALGEAALRAVV